VQILYIEKVVIANIDNQNQCLSSESAVGTPCEFRKSQNTTEKDTTLKVVTWKSIV
jgi:hypothetical protein